MIAPYKKPPKPLPVAYAINAGGRVLGEAGEHWRSIAEVPKGVVIFASQTAAMGRVIDGQGAAVCWNTRPVRWEVGERAAVLLNDPPPAPEAMNGLVRFRDWLASYGARIGAPLSSSRSLLRAVIERPIHVGWDAETVPLTEVIGGRQEQCVAPGHYTDVELWDMSAAYARTLGAMPYGGTWVEVPGDTTPTDLPVIAHAQVHVPPMHLGPLPRRLRKPPPSMFERRMIARDYPKPARMRGVWSRAELRLAERNGCRVEVDRSWVCVDVSGGDPERRPFAPWLAAILDGRKLPGYAGELVKMAGNSLWGAFAAYGDRTRVTYSKAGRSVAPEPGGFFPNRDRPLAESICAAVRVKLYDDAAHLDPISLHTDGGIFPVGEDHHLADDFTEPWRYKGGAHRLTYISPACYAYGDGDDVTYVLSGVPRKYQPEVFYTLCEVVLNYPKLPDPTTLAHYRALWETFPDLQPVGGRFR